MARYWIRSKVPYTAVEQLQQALEMHAECINSFEDDSSEPSDQLDDNGFPIASIFNFDLLCSSHDVDSCIAQIKAAAAILGINIEPQIELVEDTNWLQNCYQGQPLVKIFPYVIHSSSNTQQLPVSSINLCIEAATAFGSGEHPTTQGCLKIFAELAKKHKFNSICDMGCGSGILSIAAKKLQPWIKVVAADIEQEAVRRTQWNTKLNQCTNNFTTVASVGFQNPLTHQMYDLCFANILAKPLMHLSIYMQKYIKKSGFVIASGLLDKQANMVISSYKTCGFKLAKATSINGWTTLLLQSR
jgi:ribosomal protein L11 methyltransferase